MAHHVAAIEIILLVTISGSCFWLVFLAIVYRKHWMPGEEAKSPLYCRNIHLIGKIIELTLATAQLCYYRTRANALWYSFAQAFITTNICNEVSLYVTIRYVTYHIRRHVLYSLWWEQNSTTLRAFTR